MARLPVVSGREVVTRLEKIGFTFVRQSGSHMILRREGPPKMTVSVPDHKELKRRTLKNILRQVSLTVPEFEELG
jgi:predicted RNA binding protein YcfA (HicA-like mRNA interferase family)